MAVREEGKLVKGNQKEKLLTDASGWSRDANHDLPLSILVPTCRSESMSSFSLAFIAEFSPSQRISGHF